MQNVVKFKLIWKQWNFGWKFLKIIPIILAADTLIHVSRIYLSQKMNLQKQQDNMLTEF